jgi:hypothetical protein
MALDSLGDGHRASPAEDPIRVSTWSVEKSRQRVGRHDFFDELAMELLGVAIVPVKHVPFSEDPDKFSCGIDDWQRADVVLDEQSQGLFN